MRDIYKFILMADGWENSFTDMVHLDKTQQNKKNAVTMQTVISVGEVRLGYTILVNDFTLRICNEDEWRNSSTTYGI